MQTPSAAFTSAELLQKSAFQHLIEHTLQLTPIFPLKYMISFLIVVTVGGTSSMTGPFLAALLLGIADVTGNYYLPQVGAFITYALMLVVLMLRPQGLFARPR